MASIGLTDLPNSPALPLDTPLYVTEKYQKLFKSSLTLPKFSEQISSGRKMRNIEKLNLLHTKAASK